MSGEGGGLLVVRGCRVIGDPVLGEHVLSRGAKGLVGSLYESCRGNVRPGWGGGVLDQKEVGEAPLKGPGEVRQGLNGEVFSYWLRGDLRGAIEGEVDGGEAYREMP